MLEVGAFWKTKVEMIRTKLKGVQQKGLKEGRLLGQNELEIDDKETMTIVTILEIFVYLWWLHVTKGQMYVVKISWCQSQF